MKKILIHNQLKTCLTEKDVEDKYRNIFSKIFKNGTISSPYKTDGVLKNGTTMLMEFKFNEKFKSSLDLAKTIIQVIYYLKKFELHGDDLPNIIFIGDIDECLCLNSNALLNYLDEDIDWNIAPSQAHAKNPELLIKISKDKNITPFVYDIDDSFDFAEVVKKIKELSEGKNIKVRITELNISRYFNYFKDKIINQSKKYTAEELVHIFIGCLINPDDNYIHSRKKNCLVSKMVSHKNNGEIKINGKLFSSFFSHFETDYKISEKISFTSISDRLIDEEERRFHGEFYTPTDWVLEAHKMIEATYGEYWKDEYVVWDPACGTCNLTRDFKFKNLYCSTLFGGDLHVAEKYNPEATKFQFDFLNDDFISDGLLLSEDTKLPKELTRAIKEGKKIMVLMNPPYGTAASMFSTKRKTSISDSVCKNEMKNANMGRCCEQLYSQFLYQCIKMQRINKNINIAMFSPPLFMSGGSFKSFRSYFLNHFNFKAGYLMNAAEFADCKAWGLSFTCWDNQKNDSEFIFDIMELNEDKKPTKTGSKEIYNTDDLIEAGKWCRNKDKNTVILPNVSSALKIRTEKSYKTNIDAIGYFFNKTNNVESNGLNVSLFSTTYFDGHGTPITIHNFNDVMALFTARKTIKPDWILGKDEYLAPDTDHVDYEQWNNDAIVYSLFNNSSNQSSLRKIEYKCKTWDIKNEFFFMSNQEMIDLADEHDFEALYYDANGDTDRFVHNKLKNTPLSDDAQAVLDKARELIYKTFPMRQLLHQEHPEYHLNTWDAGWYQVKLILKKYYKEDLNEFNELYKAFESRMREGVYKFGFLK